MRDEMILLRSKNGELQRMWKDSQSGANSISFAPGDKELIISYDSQVVVWNAVKGTIEHQIGFPERKSNLARPAPDGKSMVIALDDEKAFQVWDVAKQVVVDQLRGHKAQPSEARYLDDNDLFTSDTAGVIILWDMAKRKPVRAYQCNNLEVIDLAFSPKKKRLAAACEGGDTVIIDLKNRELTSSICQLRRIRPR